MTELVEEDVYKAAQAIRAEMRTLQVRWFVDDAALAETDGHDLTPYSLLAVAALKAAGIVLPEGF